MEQNKPHILGTGLTGLVGSRITELLSEQVSFTNLGRREGYDITHPESLTSIPEARAREYFLHLAAKADVDGCEKDRELGENGEAWIVNVKATEHIVEVCKKTNRTLIYISTDFVFSGENTPEGGYTEDDTPGPVNWYSETKWRGEEVIKNSSIPYLIVRIAYPYRAVFPEKKDFVRAILARLKDGGTIRAVTDHHMSPTLIDDIARALSVLITQEKTGIFHVTGSSSVTPYEASRSIARIFGCDESLISETTRAEYFQNGATRPFNVVLNNDKIKALGVTMNTFEEGLQNIKHQMDIPHKEN